MNWDGIERRKGIDWRIRLLRIAAITSWLLYAGALILVHLARPELNTGVARYYGVEIREYWDPFYSNWLLCLIWICASFSLFSLVVGYHRDRRSVDSRRYNLILLAVITLASGILLTYKILFA